MSFSSIYIERDKNMYISVYAREAAKIDSDIDSDIYANKKYIEKSIKKCKIIADLIIKELNLLYDYKIENNKYNYILSF